MRAMRVMRGKSGGKADEGHTTSEPPYFVPPELLRPPILRAAYSDRTSWVMARMSELAYIRFEDSRKRFAELSNKLATGGFELAATFNRGGTQAFMAKSPRLAVIAFRGTEKNFRDIISDLNIRFYVDDKGRRTHRGFSRAYAHVHEDIAKAILECNDRPVYITGHSLGGALATICAKLNPHDHVAACYTFGSPRVGTRDYDVHIKIPVYRVVNRTDLVARIPFATFGYTHVGDLRYITTMGDVVRSYAQWSHGLPFFLYAIATFLVKPLKDHRIGQYIELLAEFAEKRIADERIQGELTDPLAGAPGDETPPAKTMAAGNFAKWLLRQRAG